MKEILYLHGHLVTRHPHVDVDRALVLRLGDGGHPLPDLVQRGVRAGLGGGGGGGGRAGGHPRHQGGAAAQQHKGRHAETVVVTVIVSRLYTHTQVVDTHSNINSNVCFLSELLDLGRYSSSLLV